MPLSHGKICTLYTKRRMSCAEISELDGRSVATIYNILKKNKVRLRNKSKANKLFPDGVIIILYNFGLSCYQIGELLGVHPSTIVKRFKTLHFPLRNKRSAAAIRYSDEEFRRHFCDEKFLVSLAKLARL